MSIVGGLVDARQGSDQGDAGQRAARDWQICEAWTIVVLGLIAFWLAVAAAVSFAL